MAWTMPGHQELDRQFARTFPYVGHVVRERQSAQLFSGERREGGRSEGCCLPSPGGWIQHARQQNDVAGQRRQRQEWLAGWSGYLFEPEEPLLPEEPLPPDMPEEPDEPAFPDDDEPDMPEEVPLEPEL